MYMLNINRNLELEMYENCPKWYKNDTHKRVKLS